MDMAEFAKIYKKMSPNQKLVVKSAVSLAVMGVADFMEQQVKEMREAVAKGEFLTDIWDKA